MRSSTGDKTDNPARQSAINADLSRRLTLAELHKDSFNPDYNQIVKRVSTATKGLFWGSPPPTVS